MGKNYYSGMWSARLPEILDAMKSDKPRLFKFEKKDLMCSGGMRPNSDYKFSMIVDDGIIKENKSSAVYRDLKSVLDASVDFKRLAKGLVIKFMFKRIENSECYILKMKMLCDSWRRNNLMPMDDESNV